MRFGIIADVHGNSFALEAVLNVIYRQKVDNIFCLGDVIGYYPFINQVVETLRLHKIRTIKGNHEAYFLGNIPVSDDRRKTYRLDDVDRTITTRNREWLISLEEEIRFEMDGIRFLLCHGSPWSVEEYIYPDNQRFERFGELNFDIILMGHTHIAWHRIISGKMLINPGSCGQPRDYQPGASYAVFDSSDKSVEFYRVEYDFLRLINELRERRYPKALIDILSRTQ